MYNSCKARRNGSAGEDPSRSKRGSGNPVGTLINRDSSRKSTRFTFDEEDMGASVLRSVTKVADDSIDILAGRHDEIHSL